MIDVYGTLGPSCASAEVLTQMFLAGMTGVRLNLSHVSLRESEGLLNVLHEAAQRAGVKPLLLVDLQGPELRIGPMGKPAELREDEEVRLCSEEAFSLSCSGEGTPSSPGYGTSSCSDEGAPFSPGCGTSSCSGEGAPSSPGYGTSSCSDEGAPFSPGCGTSVCAAGGSGSLVDIPVPEAVYNVLEKNTEVLLDDGRILLRVTKTGEESIFARVVRGGRLTGRKSIKVPGADIRLPAMTKADRQNVRDALGCGVTGIMQPFVRSREDLEEVRGVLAENGAQKLQLVAKIENRAGMDQLAELLPACDAVCIARGDLGNDMDLWQLPAAQKQIAAVCRAAGKYFMTATQMLSSMEQSAVPTRAEVNDIFNTVADGASGVMVTGETAVGRYPVEVIRYLAKTAAEGERYREILNS